MCGAELQNDIAQDAKINPIGNWIAKHHCNHGDERWEGLAHIAQIELFHAVEHQHTHHHQGATGGCAGNEHEQGREEQGDKKQHAHEGRCEAAFATLCNARCTFNVGGEGTRTEESAASGPNSIAHHGFFHFGNGAVGFHDASFISQSHKSAHSVEDVDHQEWHNHHGCFEGEETREIELTKDGADGLRHAYGRPICGNLRHAQRYAGQGGEDDAQKKGAFHFARHEYSTQHDADDAHDGRRCEFS